VPDGHDELALDNERFVRLCRITTPSEYRNVFQNAKRLHDRYFTILLRQNNFGHARLGLVVSCKCAKKAVSRNRIKRLVRESFRKRYRELTPYDIVVIGKSGVTTRTNEQLRQLLENRWNELVQCAA